MAHIDISARVIGDEELARALAKMSSTDIPKAIAAGVRLAARGGRTTLAQQVGKNYSLTAARIKQDVTQPSFRDGGQTAIIRTSRKPITAMQFKARQTKAGVTMAIYKGQRTTVTRAFIAKGKPFQRVGTARMPLRVIHGPSIHAIYTGGRNASQIQDATQERIREQLVKGILARIGAMGRGFGR